MKFFIYLSLFITSSAFAQKIEKQKNIDSIDAILIGSDIDVGTHAPTGYQIDRDFAEKAGLCAFYIKKGKTFHDSPIILYPRIAARGISGSKGIEKLYQDIADQYKKANPKFQLSNLPEYKSKEGITFTRKSFKNGPPPNEFEEAAYAAVGPNVVIVIASARFEKDLKAESKVIESALDQIYPYSNKIPQAVGNCLYPKK